ncbi:methyltransferase [Pseudomonas aeruginosa]|nr:methyltransferase [Pseudomonas aeruginosa]
MSLIEPQQPQPLPLFSIGELRYSQKVRLLEDLGLIDPLRFVQRHCRGDWGDLDLPGKNGNATALQEEGVLTSSYRITPRMTLTVVTDESRSVTAVFLPDEPSMI